MPESESVSKVIKSIRMYDDRTVEIVYNDDVVINNEDAMESYRILDEFTAGRRLKKLLIVGKNVDINTETRFLIVKENNSRKDSIIAEAVVVNSIAQKIKTNFYIMFLRKIYPTHFFTSVTEAEEWLKQF